MRKASWPTFRDALPKPIQRADSAAFGAVARVSNRRWGWVDTKSPLSWTRPRSGMSLFLLRLCRIRRSGRDLWAVPVVTGATPLRGRLACHGGGQHGTRPCRPLWEVAPGQRSVQEGISRQDGTGASGACQRGCTQRPPPPGLAGQPDGQPVGQRVLRRLEAALNGPSRQGSLVWERPEGEGPGVRKRARPRTRSSPSDCRVAPSPARASATAPSLGLRGARPLRATASAVLPMRTSRAPGCASAPHVICGGVCGHDRGHRRCANHRERTPARAWTA